MRQNLFFLLVKLRRLVFGDHPPALPGLKQLYGFLFRLCKPDGVVLVKCNDISMYVDTRDQGVAIQLLSRGNYEPQETELIRQHIKSGDTVLDIDANIGYFTLLMSKIVGPQGRVFAFEPDPDNFALLQKNIALNNCPTVIAVPQAASDRNGLLKLYLSSSNLGMHRTYPSRYCQNSVEIQAIRLDDYLRDMNVSIDFIKIDTEGSELAALAGMAETIKKSSPLKLLTEFAPCSIQEFGRQPRAYLELLQNWGFRLLHVNEQTTHTTPADTELLLREYTPENEKFTNLLCLKE